MALDLGVHSPLIDLFVRGDVGEDTRLLAASGQVSLPALEQVALIALMTDDSDPTVAATARDTLGRLPADGVARLLSRPETPDALKLWLLANGFVAANVSADTSAVLEEFPVDPVDPPALHAEVSTHPTPAVASADERDDADQDHADDGEVRQLSTLSVPARIKMAMLGTREQRNVLIRDPNRVVSTAVLSSPKLSETEVENFARLTNVAAEVLRIIGTNRSWLRNYGVVSALVRNPRTPPAISLGLVPRLLERDVKVLASDRNVPEALRIAARKVMAAKESRRQ